MARSKPRRPTATRPLTVPGATTAPDASWALPRVWEGVEYRLLDDLALASALFAYRAAECPPLEDVEVAWGAWIAPGGGAPGGSTPTADGARLVGALMVECRGGAAMLHGPVVMDLGGAAAGEPTVTKDLGGAAAGEPMEVAAQLVAAVIGQAAATRTETLFARPQGLDRVWVRFGFIPVPEGTLPVALRGCPGAGLFAYRGGSALWTPRETSFA